MGPGALAWTACSSRGREGTQEEQKKEEEEVIC